MAAKYKQALARIEKAKKEKSTTLDLQSLGLTTLPDQLFDLVHLKKLYLYNNKDDGYLVMKFCHFLAGYFFANLETI